MMKTGITCSVLIGIYLLLVPLGIVNSQTKLEKFPLPPSEADLTAINAEPWLQVDEDPDVYLEGPAFDRQGNLYVTTIFNNRIIKISPDKQITTIFNKKGIMPDGIAIHKDGRLFVACLSGELMAMNPDGTNITYIKPRYHGRPKSMNDLVFDSEGNLYVSDFSGTPGDPTGGIYRFSSDFKTVTPVIEGLASANGVAFAPEGNALWICETSRNTLLHIELLDDGITINPIAGATTPYHYTGGPGGCDSLRVDMAGNVYQCLIFQGRALVLNKRGVPVANVLIPGRDEGKHLITPNLAFKPDTDEAYIIAGGEGGAWIYKFHGLAKAFKLYSHQ